MNNETSDVLRATGRLHVSVGSFPKKTICNPFVQGTVPPFIVLCFVIKLSSQVSGRYKMNFSRDRQTESAPCN